MNILFASKTEDPAVWLPRLREALPNDRFVTAPSEEVDVALVATPPEGTFEKLKRLKLVQSLWMGVERLLADPAYPKGVPLARLVDPGMVAAMSETCSRTCSTGIGITMCIASSSRRGAGSGSSNSSRPTARSASSGLASSAATRRASCALDFNVVGWSRRAKDVPGVACLTDLDAVLERSDVAVCLLPLTAHTRGILNYRTLRKIRLGGAVINVARGGHLVAEDLIALLDSAISRTRTSTSSSTNRSLPATRCGSTPASP